MGRFFDPVSPNRRKSPDFRGFRPFTALAALQNSLDLGRHAVHIGHAVDGFEHAARPVERENRRRLVVVDIKPAAHRLGIVVGTARECAFGAARIAFPLTAGFF